ncbi:MAG: diacylglycerol/lipid kinase family protein [Christensenellales bacterium]|jgi:diacylglycerol kinase (ATP)
MNTCFILNPVAGKGRSKPALAKARAVFDAAGKTYEVFESLCPGHAVELARDAAQQGFDLVVSVGGDGTVCEVAQGLIHSRAVMGIIPGGTGNDYRRCLNIPKDATKAAKTLLSGNVRTVDCMQVDEFVGLNISTVGFDSEVVRHSKRYARFGGLSYLLAVLYTVPRYSSPDIRVCIDGELSFSGPRFLVAAGNGTHYGGGMRVLPDSDPADGLLDICIIDSVRVPQDYFSLLPKVIRGTYKKANRSEIHTLRARSITIQSDSPLTLNLDGTLFDDRYSISMEVIPAALRIIAGL